MPENSADECCPRIDIDPWDEKLITWDRKIFVKDRVTSLLHVPVNYGSVMTRNLALIKAEDAMPQQRLTLTDENSLWGADLYIEATKAIPSRTMETISGEFLTKVFEGPYRLTRQWIEEMEGYVARKNRLIRKLYFFYTTCPKCAKKYGKNYVVLIARV